MAEPEQQRRANDRRAQAGHGGDTRLARGLIGRLTGLIGGDVVPVEPADPSAQTPLDPLSESAVQMARNWRLPLTPQSYQVIYSHVAGERPDLSMVIERMRQAGDSFTADRVAELHERFFGAEQDGLAVYEASRNIERLLSLVQDTLEAATASTQAHGNTINSLQDELAEPDGRGRIGRLVEAIVAETTSIRMSMNKLERRVIESTTEVALLRSNLAKAQHKAHADPLTGIGNRKLMEMTLRRVAKENGTGKHPFCLMLIDIDHFSRFNKEYGTQAGDLMLKRLAHVIQESIKTRDLAARYGGEEMGIVLAETSLGSAIQFAEKLRGVIEADTLEADNIKLQVHSVTVSIGIAEFHPGEPLKRLFGRADRALKLAKEQGRNCVRSERDGEVIGRPKATT